MARGHNIAEIPEVPLVVATGAIESLEKTKKALALLTTLKAHLDVQRCQQGIHKNTGKARLRNRAKRIKVGPLIVTGNRNNVAYRAFRNLSGVTVTHVSQLNLLQLAPGGHLGRFIIWTQAAFEQLNTIFGTTKRHSAVKKGYLLPRAILSNPDYRRVINTDDVQDHVKKLRDRTISRRKPNYLKNKTEYARINPYYSAELGQVAGALKRQKQRAKHSLKRKEEHKALHDALKKAGEKGIRKKVRQQVAAKIAAGKKKTVKKLVTDKATKKKKFVKVPAPKPVYRKTWIAKWRKLVGL
jgi:large subunit ribosomal protein L4e